MPEAQKICRMYSKNGNSSGSWAAILRTRRLTVKVTSTISSRFGWYPSAQSAQI